MCGVRASGRWMSTTIKSQRKAALVILVVVVSALALLVGSEIWKSKGRKEQPQTPNPSAETPPDMKLTDMEYTEMEKGERRWKINAMEARFSEKERKSLLTTVKLVFFLKGGQEIHVESREGTLYSETKDIELRGAVQADAPPGYRIFSDKAFYRHSDGMLYSDTPISAVGGDMHLAGGSWCYVTGEQKIYVEGPVKAVVALPSSKLKTDPPVRSNVKPNAAPGKPVGK